MLQINKHIYNYITIFFPIGLLSFLGAVLHGYGQKPHILYVDLVFQAWEKRNEGQVRFLLKYGF